MYFVCGMGVGSWGWVDSSLSWLKELEVAGWEDVEQHVKFCFASLIDDDDNDDDTDEV